MKNKRVTVCSVFGLKLALKKSGTKFGYKFKSQGELAPMFKDSKKRTLDYLNIFEDEFTWLNVTKYQRDNKEVFILHI